VVVVEQVVFYVVLQLQSRETIHPL